MPRFRLCVLCLVGVGSAFVGAFRARADGVNGIGMSRLGCSARLVQALTHRGPYSDRNITKKLLHDAAKHHDTLTLSYKGKHLHVQTLDVHQEGFFRKKEVLKARGEPGLFTRRKVKDYPIDDIKLSKTKIQRERRKDTRELIQNIIDPAPDRESEMDSRDRTESRTELDERPSRDRLREKAKARDEAQELEHRASDPERRESRAEREPELEREPAPSQMKIETHPPARPSSNVSRPAAGDRPLASQPRIEFPLPSNTRPGLQSQPMSQVSAPSLSPSVPPRPVPAQPVPAQVVPPQVNPPGTAPTPSPFVLSPAPPPLSRPQTPLPSFPMNHPSVTPNNLQFVLTPPVRSVAPPGPGSLQAPSSFATYAPTAPLPNGVANPDLAARFPPLPPLPPPSLLLPPAKQLRIVAAPGVTLTRPQVDRLLLGQLQNIQAAARVDVRYQTETGVARVIGNVTRVSLPTEVFPSVDIVGPEGTRTVFLANIIPAPANPFAN
jgi:hypothetical protein